MLQHLLNALTAHAPHPSEQPVPELVELRPEPVVVQRVQSKVGSAPRSVCTSLTDLCEL